MNERYKSNVRTLCTWVESHLGQFVPPLKENSPSFEEIKPLGELALLLFGLTSSRHQEVTREFVEWAKRIGHILWPEVELVGSRLLEKTTANSSDEKPDASAMLLLFPAFEAITMRKSRFHEIVSEVLAITAHTQHKQNYRDFTFACDIAGIQNCSEDSIADLARSIAVWNSNLSLARSSWHYDVTHAIFYATRFGRRRVPWNPNLRIWLNTHLGPLVTKRLAIEDYDLAAELLASIAWADLDTTLPFWTGLDTLANIVETEGSVPAHPRLCEPGDHAFENRYHPTLVSLSALAEGALQSIEHQSLS